MFFLQIFLSLIFLLSSMSLEAQKTESYHQFRVKKMDKFVKKHAEKKAKKERFSSKKKMQAEKQEVVVVAEPEIEEVEADAFVEQAATSYRAVDADSCNGKNQSNNSSSLSCYASPAWPLYATRFKKGDYVRGSLLYQHVQNMYDSSGANKDASAMHFGQKEILFGQLFLISRLILNQQLTDPSAYDRGTTPARNDDYSPFSYLADKKIIFEGLQDRVIAPISYIRHFWEDRVSFGIVIPVVYQQNSLKYRFDDIDDIKDLFAGDRDIIGRNFGLDAQAFLDFLLKDKGFDVDKKNMSKTGLGDLSVFLQWKVKESESQYVSIGARATLPTSLQENVALLWGPKLDEGYPIFAGYMTAMFMKHAVINPHLFLQVSVAAPASRLMRVARNVSYNGDNNESKALWRKSTAGSQYMVEVGTSPNFTPFSGLNSERSALAESFREVRITPGASFEASFGNLFNNIGVNGLAFDVWYNLYVKGSDSIQENGYENGDWAFADLAENTNVIRHFVGAQVSYQVAQCRFYFDGGYVIAGRNTPATISAQLGLSIEF